MAGGKKKKAKHERPKKDSAKKAKREALDPAGEPDGLLAIDLDAERSARASGKDDRPDPAAVSRPGAPGADEQRLPLTEMVPVRFDSQMLAAVRSQAAADHRSVSAWIRRAVDLELHRDG